MMSRLSRWVCKKMAGEFVYQYRVSFSATFNAGRRS
jgi:hypothetical protein